MKRRASPGQERQANDAFRERHQLRSIAQREIDGTQRPVVVNDAESPLGWLKSRKDRSGRPLITDDQYQAGERLRADYWFAHLSPRVTSIQSARRKASTTDAGSAIDRVILWWSEIMASISALQSSRA